MKRSILYLSAGIGWLLCSCGETPEKAGKRISEFRYECWKKEHYAGIEDRKKLLEAFASGKITSRESLYEFQKSFAKAKEQVEKECKEEQKKVTLELKEKFPKEEDRKTISNSAEAVWERLREENKEEMKKFKEESDLLWDSLQSVRRKAIGF